MLQCVQNSPENPHCSDKMKTLSKLQDLDTRQLTKLIDIQGVQRFLKDSIPKKDPLKFRPLKLKGTIRPKYLTQTNCHNKGGVKYDSF